MFHYLNPPSANETRKRKASEGEEETRRRRYRESDKNKDGAIAEPFSIPSAAGHDGGEGEESCYISSLRGTVRPGDDLELSDHNSSGSGSSFVRVRSIERIRGGENDGETTLHVLRFRRKSDVIVGDPCEHGTCHPSQKPLIFFYLHATTTCSVHP